MNKKMKELLSLSKAIYNYTPEASKNFSNEGVTLSRSAMNEVLREGMLEAGLNTRTGWAENKHQLFDLIEETIDETLPMELGRMLNDFVTIHQYGENDKPEITIRRSNKQLRGRSFVTKGTAAGHYEVFRLAREGKVLVEITAATAAAQIAFEDFLTGRFSWNEFLDIIRLGMEDVIYAEIVANFDRIKKQLPAANKVSTNKFDEDKFIDLISIIEAYGDSATVLCTARFARQITDGPEWASESEKVARRERGFVGFYKGAKLVILPQTVVDEKNEKFAMDDSVAYVVPSGRSTLFHLVLQGNTHIREKENDDWSRELHTYKKFGVVSMVTNDMGTYEITSLKRA